MTLPMRSNPYSSPLSPIPPQLRPRLIAGRLSDPCGERKHCSFGKGEGRPDLRLSRYVHIVIDNMLHAYLMHCHHSGSFAMGPGTGKGRSETL